MDRGPAAAGVIDVLVVDDHPVMRWGVMSVIEESGLARVVGEAVNGAEAVRAAERLRPHVVVMDVGMPVLDGISATRRLLAACPWLRVVVLTAEPGPGRTQAALAAGAHAVVAKTAPASTLVRAVQSAALG